MRNKTTTIIRALAIHDDAGTATMHGCRWADAKRKEQMPKIEKADAIEAMLSEMRCAAPTAEEHIASRERIASLNRQLDALYAAFVTMEREKDEAIRALKPAWQPIETAPKDGTTVALTNGKAVTVGGWLDAASQGVDEAEAYLVTCGWWTLDLCDDEPTHWMPLPTAPNGTPSFDAVGKPTNDASGGTIRVEEFSSSSVNRSAPSPSAGAAKE